MWVRGHFRRMNANPAAAISPAAISPAQAIAPIPGPSLTGSGEEGTYGGGSGLMCEAFQMYMLMSNLTGSVGSHVQAVMSTHPSGPGSAWV